MLSRAHSPIGPLPENWCVKCLSEIASKIGSGSTPRGGESAYISQRENFAFVRSQQVYDFYFEKNDLRFISDSDAEKLKGVHLKEHDLLLNITGDGVTFSRCCIVPKEILPAAVNQHVSIIRVDQEMCLPGYLLSYLCHPKVKVYIASFNAGGSRRAITKQHIESFVIPLPPLYVQEIIQRVAFGLISKIQLNQQINQTLEQMAQALFKSWFVDFEPVKSKIAACQRWQAAELDEQPAVDDLDTYMNRAAMQAISGKTVEQLDALRAEDPKRYNELLETAALFPSAMQQSELGEIPEGWEAAAFQSCLSKTIGGDWGKDKPDEKHTERARIIRGTDLPKIYSGDDSSAPVRYVEAKKLKSRRLIDGDIVIEISGGSKGQPTGRSLFMNKAVIDRLGVCEPASFCRLFRPLNESLGLLLSLHLQKIYAEGKTWGYQNQSTGISNFQTKIFLQKEFVVVPPANVQECFYKRVVPLLNRLHSGENAALSALTDTLLPKLLSGELTPVKTNN